MATITVKGIPDDLYERLKRLAAEERRSINSQIIVCLERQVAAGRRGDAAAVLARADALRARLAMPPVTDAELRRAKRSGRA